MPLTISDHQPLYSAPPYTKLTPLASYSASNWGRLEHPRSLPCIHPGMVVWPTVRYESDCLSDTDPSLEVSSPPSLAPARRRSETPLMPPSREMNTRATSQSFGTVGTGTATHLQCTPAGSRALGSRTF